MSEAIALAAHPDFRSGGNPRVGCVILDANGTIVGRGHHGGAGLPHAEVVALREAGDAARGGTAVITLEPCRHTGRTPPCTEAIIAAGIAAVVFAVADPGSQSGGGADQLRAHGITVQPGFGADRAEPLVRDWLHVQHTGRPFVIAKCAMSLDGRVAGEDGTPLQLTGPILNRRTHELRAQVDAIVVGTGTALADDPRLTVRLDEPASSQPLRVVAGKRPIPNPARMRGQEFRQITEHQPEEVLRELLAEGCHSVLVEGGPTILRSWLRAGVVDEVRWTISPIILGAGLTVVGEDMWVIPVRVVHTELVGEDLLVVGAVSDHGRG